MISKEFERLEQHISDLDVRLARIEGKLENGINKKETASGVWIPTAVIIAIVQLLIEAVKHYA